MEGVHVLGGQARGSAERKFPSGVQGQTSVGVQKLKQNVKLAYNF